MAIAKVSRSLSDHELTDLANLPEVINDNGYGTATAEDPRDADEVLVITVYHSPDRLMQKLTLEHQVVTPYSDTADPPPNWAEEFVRTKTATDPAWAPWKG